MGLNDGSFPRHKLPPAFDMMSKETEKGDRSHSSEDRQRFLETLLAAKERLYLSYVGQSNRQDTEYPPSVVLGELIDYLTEHFGLEKEQLVTKHPLQPFSPQYFISEGDSRKIFSYSSRNRHIAEILVSQNQKELPFLAGTLPDPDPDYKKLSLNELISFFQHPAKYLLQNRFGIYLDRQKVLDEDREPFQMDNLKGYQLGQELLDRVLTDQSQMENFKKIAYATGMLPDGWPGDQAFNRKAEESRSFGSKLQNVLNQEKLQTEEVDLQIDNYRITGRLERIFAEEQLLYRFGRARAKDLIELWVKHLALQAVKPASHSGESCLYTRGKNLPVEAHKLQSISNSRDILRDLLDLYWKGLKENLHFFPNSSFAYAEAVCQQQKEPEDGIKAAHGKWKNSYSPYPKEGDDPYNRLLTGGENPIEETSFKEVSISFWSPFFDSLEEGVD
jgi:exodeoxyribonuclease V gamma subunit